MTEIIKIKKEGEIAEVLLNRPETFNAIHLDMMERFSSDLITLAVDDDIAGIVISGEGKAFCAGGDLKWAIGFPHGPSVALYELAARLHQATLEIRRMRKPVIAAVNGIAAGAGFSAGVNLRFSGYGPFCHSTTGVYFKWAVHQWRGNFYAPATSGSSSCSRNHCF
ncbi:MAG: enoyl-CoA hydratase/isomerase family protein [Dehalococcoidia bacterium]|nr:enoyl-CoA hydratase/isomerase family protein [Dehalococcoidia bacterium]